MILVNHTDYRDDDLRAFFLAGLHAMGSNGKSKTITVRYTSPERRARTAVAKLRQTVKGYERRAAAKRKP